KTSITAATSSSPARPWCSARKTATGASCMRIFRRRARGRAPAGYDTLAARSGRARMKVNELPKLSVRLSGGVDPRRCVELAMLADRRGFHTVWFAENAFARGVLPAASACAAATARIGIGIGVFNPYNRHPTLMAMEIAALDELAQGRARLGVGSGVAAATERMGLSSDRPLAAVRDAITIVRAMLAGDEVSYRGTVFSAKKVKLECKARGMPLLM